MEWLINRRRMMFNKAVPPVYLTFEDSRVWELVCYHYGDTELVQGTIGSGTITCDGSALVYSRSVFAPCIAIPSHKLSNKTNISASAATQNFSVVVSVDSNSAFSSLGDDDVAIRVVQHTGNTGSLTELATVTKAQWASGQSNNQVTISATSTNNCRYLQVGVYGASGVTASWTINAVTGNRQPIGITAAQCEAVTEFGISFHGSTLVTEFNNDALYFTNCTTSSSYTNFNNCSFQYLWFPYLTTYIGGGGGADAGMISFNSKLKAVRWDKINNFGSSYNYSANSNYTVITTDYYIPITSSRWYYGTFYVKDECIADYSATGQLGTISGVTIKSLSDLATDHPDCPWLDDLRAKGLIPSN